MLASFIDAVGDMSRKQVVASLHAGCVYGCFFKHLLCQVAAHINVGAADTHLTTLQMLYMCEYCVVPCYLFPLAGLLCDRLSLYFQLVCLKLVCLKMCRVLQLFSVSTDS